MNAKELIAELSKLPQDIPVLHAWDGGLRTEINCVWLAKSGVIGTSDFGEFMMRNEDTPIGSPDVNDVWYTPTE